MTKRKKPKIKDGRTIELVKHTYQPNKAELEEEFSVDVPGATALEKFKRLTRAMVQPVNARLISKPRNRR